MVSIDLPLLSVTPVVDHHAILGEHEFLLGKTKALEAPTAHHNCHTIVKSTSANTSSRLLQTIKKHSPSSTSEATVELLSSH